MAQNKYRPVAEWLADRQRTPFETTIGEIERVLGFQLPESYRRHVPIWYGNRPATVIGAMAEAGWRARKVDLGAERLVLEPSLPSNQPMKDVRLPRSAPTPIDEAALWEGEVQIAVVRHLSATGWDIVAVADTRSKQRGDDIRGKKGSATLVVEVKGYPTRAYADPRRSAEVKVAHPSAQASHYLGDALLGVLRVLGTRPGIMVAIAVPDARYRTLFAELRDPLTRLEIGVLFVGDGDVEEYLPLPDPTR